MTKEQAAFIWDLVKTTPNFQLLVCFERDEELGAILPETVVAEFLRSWADGMAKEYQPED